MKDDFKMEKLDDAIEQYNDDIPNEDALQTEIFVWRERFMFCLKEDIPTTVAGALKVIDKSYFPNLFILLKLVATFPITSCE